MSLVMRSPRAFSEDNGRLLQCSNVRSCSCCPYGYHIDLDFVRYCEALANAKPSEEELQRRSRRRSRKSMEFMLGLDKIFDEWDAANSVHAVPEADSEPESPHPASLITSTPYAPHRRRSASVPRFTYGTNYTRSDSPISSASSVRATGSDIATNYAYRPHPEWQSTANSKPETKQFLKEILDGVCNDFERTLERTSMKRKKNLHSFSPDNKVLNDTTADRNNNKLSNGNGPVDKRGCQTWDAYFNPTDSCVAGNKSPKSSRYYTRSNTLPFQQKLSPAEQQYESYVQATVAANSKSPVELLEASKVTETTSVQAPPPPPPRRNHANKLFSPASLSNESAKSPQSSLGSPLGLGSSVDNAVPDAHTLYNIRQQMALSLKRMKDLEEQVKSIPEMQLQLTLLKNEKQRLEMKLQNKEDELLRARDIQRLSSSPSPVASPKYASPVQFTPQRISPISLESLGNRLRANSTSSERQLKAIMKRDVAVMCSRPTTRDVAVGSPTLNQRSISTSPLKEIKLNDCNEPLFSKIEVDKQVQMAVQKFEKQYELDHIKEVATVGTQMSIQKTEQKDKGMQTIPKPLIVTHSIGLNTKFDTRDMSTSCKPDMRSIGCSEDNISAILCEKCSKRKRSIACGTDDDASLAKSVKSLSLKHLDMPVRSNTFSLGENEKLNLIRKTVATQYAPIPLHTTGCQTLTTQVSTKGVQSCPTTTSTSTQSNVERTSVKLDTFDLVRLSASKVVTEEISSPVDPETLKPKTRNFASNTEKVKTTNTGVNPSSPFAIRHVGSNTDKPHKKDVGCGDKVKPHISIACADNYCDSCKDAIKNLAKDFSKSITPSASPLPTRSADSKIPRPRNLPSPSPVRKTFQRQNTYTIVPTAASTTASSKESFAQKKESQMEKQRALHEKPPSLSSFHHDSSLNENQHFITEPLGEAKGNHLFGLSEDTEDEKTSLNVRKSSESYDVIQVNEGDLIVKEETKVQISWSRDASPAPLSTSQISSTKDDSPTKSLQNSLNEKIEAAAAAASAAISSSKSSQKQKINSSQIVDGEQNQEKDKVLVKPPTKALLQKLAMVESKPREKFSPSKEMLSALKIINESLLKKLGAKPFSSASLKSSKSTIQQEWFRVTSTEKANPHEVEDYLDCIETFSVPLLEYCVNMVDVNGNTAMHYAVSHGNFDVVSILLDSKVCNVNQTNNAGYTCVMLVSLAKLKNPEHRTVVERLFQMADVNIRAKKHCQTALMLAVSHGNLEMVEMLLAAGADINIQDEDGSTALMCAAEHGRVDIVKHLLSQNECNSLIQDVDGSTAFKIAWQAGHRDTGMLLYIHEQMLRSKLPNRGETSPTHRSTSSTIPPKNHQQPQQHKRQPSK